MNKAKKWLITFFLLAGLSMAVLPVAAETNDPGEVIQDDETPEALRNRQRQQTQMITMAVLMVIMMGAVVLYRRQEEKPLLTINSVEYNDDGSMYIVCDYAGGKDISQSDENVTMKKGTAILLNELEGIPKGSGKLAAIINEDTVLEWQLGDQILIVEGKRIYRDRMRNAE